MLCVCVCVCVCVFVHVYAYVQVGGVNGMLIANKKEDNQMKTFVTYNKGQTWSVLPAPAKDASGQDISCSLVGE